MAENVTDLTLMHLRRMDQTMSRVLEVIERHDVRLGRIEKSILEIKSDQILMENQLLNRMNEILDVVRRVDEHQERLDRLEQPI
jgi:hypothetical protein